MLRAIRRTIWQLGWAFAVLGGMATYFTYAVRKDLFPAPAIESILGAFEEVRASLERPWYLSLPENGREILEDNPALHPGLVLLSGVTPERRNFIRVIDRQGTVIQSWDPNWFDIWPKKGEFAKELDPQQQPGALVHGTAILPTGDAVFNFEHLSTVRLNACGQTVWKLKNEGHHSISITSDGNIWAAGGAMVFEGEGDIPNVLPLLPNYSAQEISPDGEILRSVHILDVLRDNDLLGLIYLSNNEPTGTEVSGDISHFNDLDIFPEGMKSDVFAPGDIMVSLRNMNTVLVLDGNDLSLKFQATGGFLRQHDPDFAGGNKITLMDNRNTFPEKKDEDPGSRILMLDAKTGEQSVIYERSGDDDFFTPIMGKHQMLGNGNILITSSLEGRAFEVSPKGEILWQVNNPAGKEFMGVISEAAILPVEMDAAFFQNARAACSG